MPDNVIAPPEGTPVRITGVPRAETSHPALRKIARAVISIAERHIADEHRDESAEQDASNA